MNRFTIYLLVFLMIISTAAADMPSPFDPRAEGSEKEIGGAAYVIRPAPFTSNYLIVTRPIESNVDGAFFTFEASAEPELKIDRFLGQFVFIEAIRIEPSQKGAPALCIVGIRPITKW